MDKLNAGTSVEKILLTGSTGFIGANLLRKFLELERFKVHIFLRKNSKTWRIEDLLDHKNLTTHYVDISDFISLKKTVEEIQPDYILHLATYGAYPTRQTETDEIIKTNFTGTVNLMEACQGVDYKCFINTGSSSEYGKKNTPMSEKDVLEPIDVYGVTKAATELYGHMLYRNHGKNIVHLRLFSTYGYYEEGIRLVPSLAKAMVRGDESIKLTPGLQTRDFIFIEDVVEAYLRVMSRCDIVKGETLNIGTGKSVSVRYLAESMKKVSSSDVQLIFGGIDNRPNETYMWCADTAKMERLLDWRPKHSLEEGLSKTLVWFKKNIGLYDGQDG